MKKIEQKEIELKEFCFLQAMNLTANGLDVILDYAQKIYDWIVEQSTGNSESMDTKLPFD